MIPPAGRLLGVDVGTVRVGLAVCDADRTIASPLDTYTRRDAARDAAYFVALAKRESAVGFVVGLAVMLDGTEQTKARECRAFGAWLEAATGLPVEFQDERFTSDIAEEAMKAAGMPWQKRRERRDKIAAQLILQGFLDANRPLAEPH